MAERCPDKIHIRDLEIECIVGVNPEERRAPQRLLVNITLYTDLRRPGRSDDIADTVDYHALVEEIRAQAEASSYFLIEAWAERIAEICLGRSGIERVKVAVEKPQALTGARPAVEVVRDRAAQHE